MGNCLKTEASDDESLLGDSDESVPSERGNGRHARHQRRQRRRTRVQAYIQPNQMTIPDPTHYFNLGSCVFIYFWNISKLEHVYSNPGNQVVNNLHFEFELCQFFTYLFQRPESTSPIDERGWADRRRPAARDDSILAGNKRGWQSGLT